MDLHSRGALVAVIPSSASDRPSRRVTGASVDSKNLEPPKTFPELQQKVIPDSTPTVPSIPRPSPLLRRVRSREPPLAPLSPFSIDAHRIIPPSSMTPPRKRRKRDVESMMADIR